MADVKINSERAKIWVKGVQTEVAGVNKTLKEVEELCKTFPGEDDIVFQVIEQTGEFIEDAWGVATHVYQEAWETIESGIDVLVQTGQNIAEWFDDLKGKIK